MHVVIFDTEFTSWEDAYPLWSGRKQHRELIQIGAIKLTRGESWEAAPRFEVKIKPVINPTLSTFITELTGVTQAQIDDLGQDMLAGLLKFKAFIHDAVPASNGGDINVIAETCGHHHVIMPFDTTHFISLRPAMYLALEKVLGHPISISDYPSGKVHELLDIKLPAGHLHNAVHDVCSLAAVCQELDRRGHNVLPWPTPN